MTRSEKFCRLNGTEWNENQYRNEGDNPTFADAKSILEVMMTRWEDYEDFIWHISKMSCEWTYWVLNPDKLLEEAVKWCEEHFPEPQLLGLGMSGEQMFKMKGK